MMGRKVPVETQKSPYALLKGLEISDVHIYGFLGDYLNRAANVTLPSMYEMLEKEGRIDNLRFASGKKKGTFKGFRFNDTDVHKWAEAVSFLFATKVDTELEKDLDCAIEEIRAAQDEDGYVDSYYPKDKRNERWTDLGWSHEMYCAGHLIQAAVAHKRVTGKNSLLEIAKRFADHIDSLFGPNKKPELDGHPEVEMALVELYRETDDPKYLKLADYFVRARGKGYASSSKYPGITREYFVDHKPFVELDELVGHAVRMLYLCCGAADLYLETGAEDLWRALERLWHDLVEKKMYITGGCGARAEGEAFGKEYELPNMKAYTETCAAIASFMWNYRMFLATNDAKYVDTMEQVLYNGLLSGISLDGKHYFYDNPLESDGTHTRKEWFECACCPPNIARLITSLPGYIYSLKKDDSAVFVNLYEKSTANISTRFGRMTLLVETDYPWSAQIQVRVIDSRITDPVAIYFRIPGWTRDFSVRINGEDINVQLQNGYAEIKKIWKTGDSIDLSFSMPIETIQSHPFVEENRGKIAIKRGPIVYCAEAADNEFEVRTLGLPKAPQLQFRCESIPVLGKIVSISGHGFAQDMKNWEGKLYIPTEKLREDKPVEARFVPYFSWANRTRGPMIVWIRSV